MMIARACFVTLLLLTAALPPARAGILEDRGIEEAIKRSVIFREVLIDRSMVQLYVRYGLVEMRGQVADERERDLLTYFVRALPEVKQVDNRLFVDSAGRRNTDRWRAIRQRSLLTMQAGIDVSRTEITFASGRWRLVGEIADNATLVVLTQRLHELTPTDPLAVAVTVSSAPAAKKSPVDDASIAALVRSALESSPDLVISDPQVSCRHGTVVLHGSVRSAAEKERAAKLASLSRGVVAVVSELTARP